MSEVYMLKKLFFICLALPILFNPQHVYGQIEDDVLTVNILSETVMYGLPFDVEVSLKHVYRIVGYQVKLLYRSDLISYVSFDSTKTLHGTVFNHEDGVIYINYLNVTTPIHSDTLILTVTFESLYEFDQSIKLFSLDETYNEFITLTNDGLEVLSSHNNIVESTPKPYGDVTLDDTLSIDDVAMLQLFLAEKITLSAQSQYVADVNVDGKLSVLDIALMQLMIAGKINDLGPVKTHITVSVLNEDIDVMQYIGRPLHLKPYSVEGFTFSHFHIENEIVDGDFIVTENLTHIQAVMLANIEEVSFASSHIQTNTTINLPQMMKARNTLGEVVDIEVDWDQTSFQTHQTGVFEINGSHPLYDSLITYTVHVSETNDNLNIISGYVYGNQKEETTVILSNNTNVWLTKPDANGYFEFIDLLDATYVVRVDQVGYKSGSPITVTFNTVEKAPQALRGLRRLPVKPKRIEHISFFLEEIREDGYYYEWFFTGDVFGYEQSVTPIQPLVVIISDEVYTVSNEQAALTLQTKYKQYLVDDNVPWNSEFASRLLDMFDRVPMTHNSLANKYTIWMITSDFIDNDVLITYGDAVNTVIISVHTFSNATPKMASVDGIQGIYFSHRLYHAIVRFVTEEGYNIHEVNHILRSRFGVEVLNINYEQRTVFNETSEAFEQFKPYELLQILEMFEEMPSGFHKINELTFLVRRKDGSENLMYPQAAAIAWVSHGYIEFMEKAFKEVPESDLHRLILHEKAHFMWEFLFSNELKEAWIEIGGWYQSDKTASGWATTKTTEFVTAYAHGINPNEDMAESIAYYILNPDKLRARAPEKYRFIEEKIMKGSKYISQIREDLTFEVFNLFPDYDYPGKIIRTKVTVEGLPEEDKFMVVEVELNSQDGLFDGASSGYLRIYSVENPSIFFDMGLTPINAEGSILRGSHTISKLFKSGYYSTSQIILNDRVGNQRFEGQGSMGFKAFVNNPLEDITPPQLVEESFLVEVSTVIMNEREVFFVNVSFEMIEQNILDWNTAHIYINAVDSLSYSYQSWGFFNRETNRAHIHFYFTHFYPNGYYDFGQLMMVDLGGNTTRTYLHTIEGFNEKHKFKLDTKTPDDKAPEIDVNRITVDATPTQPDAPNGETRVIITFYAKDNLSGLGNVSFILRDPLGGTFFQYHYHENFGTMFFNGDPTEWKKYTIQAILPVGSPPGIWGLLEINVGDKAGNFKTFNFSELISFQTLE